MSTEDCITQLGPYLLDKVVGRGSSGVVWRAYDEVSGELVAVKMLDEWTKKDMSSQARFVRECELVGAFAHPGLVRLRAAGRTNEGVDYLVMDLAMGPTLQSRWAKGPPMSAGEAIRTLLAVAEAVSVMHEVGWVHRDIKPANIIMDPQGYPRLLDFGLTAKLEDDRMLTEAGYFVGTPIYLAPEQLLGSRPTAMMDVYALGVILYEGLIGQPPFSGDTERILKLKSFQDPPEYQGFSPLSRLLASVLSRRPDGRPKDAGAFADALRAIADAMPEAKQQEDTPPSHLRPYDYNAVQTISSNRWTASETALQLVDSPEKQFFQDDTEKFVKALTSAADDGAWVDQLLRLYQPGVIPAFKTLGGAQFIALLVAVTTAILVWSLIAVVPLTMGDAS
ncbi:MAG: serine/threonine protein kinase [Myxococcales bacterium]|nr:serine/threonine protein kinase [Myxococcales bacterium]